MGEVGEDVVGCGVGQVVCQILEGSLSSDDSLSAIAKDCQLHTSKTASEQFPSAWARSIQHADCAGSVACGSAAMRKTILHSV